MGTEGAAESFNLNSQVADFVSLTAKCVIFEQIDYTITFLRSAKKLILISSNAPLCVDTWWICLFAHEEPFFLLFSKR